MQGRTFTTLIENTHRAWLSDHVSIPVQPSGIDLADATIGIELKSRWRAYSNNFAVHHYQVDLFRQQNPTKTLYWAFLLYELHTPPQYLTKRTLKKAVTAREVWFFPWDWIKQFPVATPRTGPYIYIHARDFPPPTTFTTVHQDTATLYLPPATSLEKRLAP